MKDFNGLTMAEVAEQIFDNYIDIDVVDSEVDMMVAFVHEIGNSNDSYEKFLELLSKKCKVINLTDSIMTVDFSGYFKQFNDELIKLREKSNWPIYEFDEDETYYDFVLMLESLISGNATDSSYAELLTVLK